MKNLLLFFFIPFLTFSQNNPTYEWVHPKPIGTSFGSIKMWDENNFYLVGSAGSFVKTTDAGQTFNINPNAGVPFGLPSNLTEDLYGAHYFDMNNFILCGVFGLTKTTDGGQTFNELAAGNFSTSTLRDIQFIDANNGFVVGTSSTKMAKTTDGGATWEINPLLPPTTHYAINAFNSNHIVVASATSSGTNIRVTTDGGASWSAAAAGTGTIYSLAFFDTLIGFAGSSSGRGFKTIDGGFTWTQMTQMNAPTTSTFYDIFIKGTDVYFVEDDSLLFVSSDSGATFTTLQYLPTGKPKQVMRKADYFGSNIIVVGDNGYFFKSTDNGTTWTSPSEVVASGIIREVYGNQTGKMIVVGTNSPEQVLVSEDFGNTFTPVALSVSAADIRGFYMLDNLYGFAVGNTGRIWKTTDGGYNWDLYVASTAAFSDVAFLNNSFGVASGNNGQVFKTTDSGSNWINISPPTTVGFNGVAIIDTNTILVAGSNIVYKTTNGGTNWTQITTGIPPSSIPVSKIRMLNPSTGYIIGGSGVSGVGYIYKTTDEGETWANTNFPYTNNMLYNISFRNDSDYVVVGAGGGVFHTTNDGASWSQYNLGLPNSGISQVIGVTFVHEDTLLVGGIGADLIKVALEPIVPVELTSFTAAVNADNVILIWTTATELNNRGFEIERKVSASNQWISLGFVEGSGTTTQARTYSFEDFDLTPGSYNYRIRQIDYDGSSSVYNLSETILFGAPTKFELAQNYPNPFNPSTTISFSIPQKSEVSVKIYDILGNEVATLVNETREAGRYSVNFNASNISSGVYFYKLQAGNYVETKKMILIK